MNTDLRVAVCSNRHPEAVAESLEALRGQVGTDALVLVTSGLTPAEDAAHRSAFGGEGPHRVAPRPLRGAQPGARLGVRVGRGCARLRGRRRRRGPRLVGRARGAAGTRPRSRWRASAGPIRPRYTAAPPPWFSDGIAHVLTLVDRGPDARDLDPDAEAVYGANISFRVGPLREAGGFDPALGHAGARIFFAEEDEAQRALVRLGYGVRYVPDAGVLHVIPADRMTRGSFIRRRFAFGRALGMRGGRARGLAARQALACGGGRADRRRRRAARRSRWSAPCAPRRTPGCSTPRRDRAGSRSARAPRGRASRACRARSLGAIRPSSPRPSGSPRSAGWCTPRRSA